MNGYSFTKGLSKGLWRFFSIAAALAVFAGFSDLSIWDLIVTYIKPVIGTMTVGGILAVIVNYFKYRATH